MARPTALAILFPGQGATASGAQPLVQEHCTALYRAALDALDADPFEHAERSTRYAQPAIFLASLAGWRALAAAGVRPFAFAGHSLGELSALAAADVLTPQDALDAVLTRGQLMDEIGGSHQGGMLAILKGSAEQAERLALAHGVHVANYNAPGQTVLSGATTRLESVARDARAIGLRTLRLNVSGAFHTPALEPVRIAFQQALRNIEMKPPSAPVLSSMTAQPFTDPVNELGAALVRPVRWSETMSALQRMGAPGYLDVGPERVVEKLAARNLGDVLLVDRESLHVHA